MYEDRIEVFSPGGLPKGITREEYLNGQISVLRLSLIHIYLGDNVKRVISVELSQGQMINDVKLALNGRHHVDLINRCV